MDVCMKFFSDVSTVGNEGCYSLYYLEQKTVFVTIF